MIGKKRLSFILDGREGYGVICGLNSVLVFLSVFKTVFVSLHPGHRVTLFSADVQ